MTYTTQQVKDLLMRSAIDIQKAINLGMVNTLPKEMNKWITARIDGNDGIEEAEVIEIITTPLLKEIIPNVYEEEQFSDHVEH